MSQYPHPFGYGQYYSHQPPQPYNFQNAASYPPTGYDQPYSASTADWNRGASQASFDYNANRIPGLGLGAQDANQSNPAHSAMPWSQPHFFQPPAPHVPPPQSYSAGSIIPQQAQSNRTTRDSRGSPKAQKQPASVPSYPTTNIEMEEGELSEGQFEDLYEPREPVTEVAKPTSRSLPTTSQSQPPSPADTPDGGFYGSDEDEAQGPSKGNEGRERSASYSPFLSPRENQTEIPAPQPAAGKGDDHRRVSANVGGSLTFQSDLGPQSNPVSSQTNAAKPAVPGLHLTGGPAANESKSEDSSRLGTSTRQSPKQSFGPFKSLQEAKKEAQKAILRLWPLGVKYQNYIDEGFDEQFIKGLFRDLHLDMPKTTTDEPRSEADQSRPGAASVSSKSGPTANVQSQQTASAPKDLPAVSKESKKGEERKDRIARLLAAKASKAPPAAGPVPAAPQDKPTLTEAQPQNSATPVSGVSKPKTWGEKERLLQQKIAALQKSREAQAQKSTTGRPEQGIVEPGNDRATGSAQSDSAAGGIPVSIPPGPGAGPLRGPSNQISQARPSPSIPGLLLSPNAQPNAASQRKRPVASDFVDSSSGPSGHLKRPFGQARKETSLIIDVSDGSDDEEMEMDVDMDMGSPVEPFPIQSTAIPTKSGPSIRDFPPLTDTLPQRQLSSPAPSLTPPNGPPNGKRRVTELDLKEKAIQEMKRKIALAEARRKAKQSPGGSLTPNLTGQTPEPKEPGFFRPPPTETESVSSSEQPDRPSPQVTPEAASARLPKQSDTPRLDSSDRAERRGRIMSLDLPRVDSSLEEKLKRLKQLRDEEARLQAEIDRSLAEKKLLTDELEKLDLSPTRESPQASGLGSGKGSGPSVHQEERESRSPIPASEGAREAGDVSMDEAESSEQSQESSHSDTPSERETDVPSSVANISTAQDGINGNGDSMEIPNGAAVVPATDNASGHQSSERVSGSTDVEDVTNAAIVTPEPLSGSGSDSAAPVTQGQVDISAADDTTPMELQSRSPSTEATDHSHCVAGDDSTVGVRQPSTPLPDQISNVAQPRQELQEIEDEAPGEVHDEPASKSDSTLMPYKSPLRYFRAYRFHPNYRDSVAGGLKSLTYSNRIDPLREFCPFELNGEPCPANCQFQHFGMISAPDDQILLELGNPDDYSGEEKSRFIQGLRELLQRFKADKIKDFDTIARGIIEFRAEILKDKSKVLRLDGVTV